MKADGKLASLRIWRPADWPGLELRIGTSFQHPYPRHWHEELFFSAVTAGAGHFYYRGAEHVATRGSLVVVAPGEVHSHYDGSGGRSFRSLHVPPALFATLAAEVTEEETPAPDLFSNVLVHPRLLHAFHALHQALDHGGTKLGRESLLLRFVGELLPQLHGRPLPARAGHERCAVRRAREFLQDHFAEEVSLKELSRVARFSPGYLNRVFAQEVGLPPHAYQIHLRILHAKALLRKNLPSARVAAITGFVDQSHFTRHFRRLTGLSPARYTGRR